MLLEFIAIVAAGFALAGVALMLNVILGKRLPGWTFPAAAGVGMLAMAIWLEYSWLDRATTNLPEQIEVASTNQSRSWHRPWTYVVPLVDRFIAIDHRFDRRNPALPDHVLTQVLLIGRWQPSRQFGVMFDCVGYRRADMVDEVVFADDGSLRNARWRQLDADDGVLRAACGG